MTVYISDPDHDKALKGNAARWQNKKPNTGLCFTCNRMPRVGKSAYCRTCRPKHAGRDTHYYGRRKLVTDPHSICAVLMPDGLTVCPHHGCKWAGERRAMWRHLRDKHK